MTLTLNTHLLTKYDGHEFLMLHTKFHRNLPAGSEEDFEGFLQ